MYRCCDLRSGYREWLSDAVASFLFSQRPRVCWKSSSAVARSRARLQSRSNLPPIREGAAHRRCWHQGVQISGFSICRCLFLLSDCCEVRQALRGWADCVFVCAFFPFPPSELELCLSSRSLVTLISVYFHCTQLNKSFPLLGTCGHAIHECE